MLGFIQKKILSNKRLRKAILRRLRRQQMAAFEIGTFPVSGLFTLDDGTKISVHENLRSFVVPNWVQSFQRYYENGVEVNTSFDTDIKLAREEYKLFFIYLEKALMSLRFEFQGKSALEIGAGNTLLSHLMAERYPELSVSSSDVDAYYSSIEKVSDIELARNKVRAEFSRRVPFQNDSISRSSFADSSFDLIFSNTVLEHIDNINAAFKEMKRILKPGGVAFHIYNPFFSYNGAHTFCTTDHPWGHCIMTPKEMNRYSDSYYPEFSSVSKAFFENDLNKKSLSEFEGAIKNAGFKTYTILRETNFNLQQLLLPHTLELSRKNYPNATLEDLLTTSAIVILEK
jgi:ubiquinone/menaquinone biosynthesis C-methylase UbiE